MSEQQKHFEELTLFYREKLLGYLEYKIEKARNKEMVAEDLKSKLSKKVSSIESSQKFIDFLTLRFFKIPYDEGANIQEIISNIKRFVSKLLVKRPHLENHFSTFNREDYNRVYKGRIITQPPDNPDLFNIVHVPSSWFNEDAYYVNAINFNESKVIEKLAKYCALRSISEENLFSNLKDPISKRTVLGIVPDDIAQKKAIILKHLAFLKGEDPSKRKIMKEEDFEYLISLVNELVIEDKCPEIPRKIPSMFIKTESIRFTFYKLHKELWGTQIIRSFWIDFLKTAFVQFENQEWSTIKTKFSTVPHFYPF